jgi:TetR/AcrR family transcriptional repressor of nem operon
LTQDPEGVALGVYASLIGALQLARAVKGTALSDRILAAGADAARALVQPRHNEGPTVSRSKSLPKNRTKKTS